MKNLKNKMRVMRTQIMMNKKEHLLRKNTLVIMHNCPNTYFC